MIIGLANYFNNMTSDDKRRYSRQISIEEIGIDGQEKLMKATIAVIGCGALGSMVAMQLAGAGVGTLRLADFDTIDVSNLQRQFFFKDEECGNGKLTTLTRRVKALNPDIRVEEFPKLISESNVDKILIGCDFVVDASDNPATKHLIESSAVKLGIPCCIAGVSGFKGQVMTVKPGSASFAETFADSDDMGFTPCSIGGVLGPAAALCAAIQASETIKSIVGIGELLIDKVLVFNLFNNSFETFHI